MCTGVQTVISATLACVEGDNHHLGVSLSVHMSWNTESCGWLGLLLGVQSSRSSKLLSPMSRESRAEAKKPLESTRVSHAKANSALGPELGCCVGVHSLVLPCGGCQTATFEVVVVCSLAFGCRRCRTQSVAMLETRRQKCRIF